MSTATIHRHQAQRRGSNQAHYRIERATQRALRQIAAARLRYASASARIEAAIDTAESRLTRAADEATRRMLSAHLQRLGVRLRVVEDQYSNERQLFLTNIEFLPIQWEVAQPYLEGWAWLDNTAVEASGALRLEVIQEDEEPGVDC